MQEKNKKPLKKVMLDLVEQAANESVQNIRFGSMGPYADEHNRVGLLYLKQQAQRAGATPKEIRGRVQKGYQKGMVPKN